MILCYKLSVVWALISDQHQMPQSRNPIRPFLQKKKKTFSLFSVCLCSFGVKKNDLLSDSVPVKKICFQALGPFPNEFSGRIFL